MFVAHDVVLDVGFAAARPRLLNLFGRSGLTGASRAAYDEGLDTMLRVIPFGDAPPAAQLISVRFLEPSERDDSLTTALRWESTGAAGGPFPVLDADIALTPAGPRMTRLALAGIYRLPFGGLGTVIDPVLVHRVADMTMCALLKTIGDSLIASPAGPEPHGDCGLLSHPASEPGTTGWRPLTF